MGDIAEMMLDGILDEQTGEYLGEGVGYPRTSRGGFYNTMSRKETASEKKIRSVRKELAIMINEQNIPVQEARKLINIKYGKGWRERGLTNNPDDQWSKKDLKPFM
jgi:hypothetical protein